MEREELKQIYDTIAMLSNMVMCGEQHSEQSAAITTMAYDILAREMKKESPRVDQPEYETELFETKTHVVIPYFDRPNKNGRMHTREDAQAIANYINDQHAKHRETVFGKIGMTHDMDVLMSDISHVITNAEAIDGQLACDIRILETTKGKELASIMSDDETAVVFRLAYRRNEETGEVTFATAHAIPKSDDAY